MILGWFKIFKTHKPIQPPAKMGAEIKKEIQEDKAKVQELNKVMDKKSESFRLAAEHISSLLQSDEIGHLRRKGVDPHEYFRRP